MLKERKFLPKKKAEKKILGSSRRWKRVRTSLDKLMMDSPIARMSNKDLRGSYSLLCYGHTTDLLQTRSKLKFHQHDTTNSKLSSSTFFFKLPFALKCLTPSVSGIWMEDLPTPLQLEQVGSILRYWESPIEIGIPALLFNPDCLLLEVHGHRPHPGVPNGSNSTSYPGVKPTLKPIWIPTENKKVTIPRSPLHASAT